jgi:hypothetical protein
MQFCIHHSLSVNNDVAELVVSKSVKVVEMSIKGIYSLVKCEHSINTDMISTSIHEFLLN